VGVAAEEEQEGAEEVERARLALHGAIQQRGQVEADEALRPAAGAVVVQAPNAARLSTAAVALAGGKAPGKRPVARSERDPPMRAPVAPGQHQRRRARQ
jgi:UDP-N-acetylglucosamine enolpyruvyl transferase